MANDKQLAVNVFDNNTTQQTPEEQRSTQTPTTQNETKAETPDTTGQNTQTATTQQTATNTNDIPTYFIYGGVVVGLLILLALLVIIRKINKRTR